IGVSAAAQLAVLPITLTHFNQLSTIGVVANLGVVPLAGVATVTGLLAVGMSFLSESAAQVGFDAVWPVLLALRALVAIAAAVPGAVVHLPAPPWVAIACYTGALALGLVWWHLRAERPRVANPSGAAALALLALAVAVAAWPALRPPDGRLRPPLARRRNDLARPALAGNGGWGAGAPRRPVASGGCPARRSRDASSRVDC